MPHQPPPPRPVHNILFTIPRTASHLLTQLLNLPAQPSIKRPTNNQDGYLFLPAAVQRFRNNLMERALSEWSDTEKQGLRDAFQTGFNDWTGLIEGAGGEGKGTYIKEHVNWLLDPVAHSRLLDDGNADEREFYKVSWPGHGESGLQEKSIENVTCLPDGFLLNKLKPTFLLRHPALTFPSALRTSLDIEGLETALSAEKTQQWECTYAWTLSLYKFYIQQADFDRATLLQNVEYPIVLDAADLGDETLVRQYARAVGLDEEKVRFEWEAAGVEGLGKTERRMKSTVLASKGVEKGKLGAESFDLEILQESWREEFGDVLAERLSRLVSDSMEAYEELSALRLRVQ